MRSRAASLVWCYRRDQPHTGFSLHQRHLHHLRGGSPAISTQCIILLPVAQLYRRTGDGVVAAAEFFRRGERPPPEFAVDTSGYKFVSEWNSTVSHRSVP